MQVSFGLVAIKHPDEDRFVLVHERAQRGWSPAALLAPLLLHCWHPCCCTVGTPAAALLAPLLLH
jgi:hypothetical protein